MVETDTTSPRKADGFGITSAAFNEAAYKIASACAIADFLYCYEMTSFNHDCSHSEPSPVNPENRVQLMSDLFGMLATARDLLSGAREANHG